MGREQLVESNMLEQKIEILSKADDSLVPDSPSKQLEKGQSLEADETQCECIEIGYGAGDAALSCAVVAPLVVSVWRGTWGLMDLHHDMFPYAQTYVLGIVLHICFALIRSQLLSRSRGAWSSPKGGAGRWVRERVLSRVYTYIFILSCIMHWRGGWGLFDATVIAILPKDGDPHRPVLIAALVSGFYICMLWLRSSRNFLASPYFLVTDGKEATYLFTTRFRKTVSLTYLNLDTFDLFKELVGPKPYG